MVHVQEWTSGDRTQMMNWNTNATGTIIYHEIFLQSPLAFTETKDQAEDIYTYLATLQVGHLHQHDWFPNPSRQGSGVTYMTDFDTTCRPQFSNVGSLNNTVFSGPKGISRCVLPFFFVRSQLRVIRASH